MSGQQAVIVSGSGSYRDPWHPFAGTSARLAGLLATAGFTVTVEDDLDAAMTRLDGVSLLVVNAGDSWRSGSPAPVPPEAIAGFRHAVQRGVGILAMHTAPATMRGYPEWASTVGAIWLPGISGHPPAAEIAVTICEPQLSSNSPLPGNGTIQVFDERYCHLQQVGESEIVATHTVDGTIHPAVWLRTVGRSRVAVDLLGHDERSYDSVAHRSLIIALAHWAVDPAAGAP